MRRVDSYITAVEGTWNKLISSLEQELLEVKMMKNDERQELIFNTSDLLSDLIFDSIELIQFMCDMKYSQIPPELDTGIHAPNLLLTKQYFDQLVISFRDSFKPIADALADGYLTNMLTDDVLSSALGANTKVIKDVFRECELSRNSHEKVEVIFWLGRRATLVRDMYKALAAHRLLSNDKVPWTDEEELYCSAKVMTCAISRLRSLAPQMPVVELRECMYQSASSNTHENSFESDKFVKRLCEKLELRILAPANEELLRSIASISMIKWGYSYEITELWVAYLYRSITDDEYANLKTSIECERPVRQIMSSFYSDSRPPLHVGFRFYSYANLVDDLEKKNVVSSHQFGPSKIFTNLTKDQSDVDLEFSIAGVSYENDDGTSRQRIISGLVSGSLLRFLRDPGNPHDENAIRILDSQGRQCGFVPKDIAKLLARELEAGTEYETRVVEVVGGGACHYGCKVRCQRSTGSNSNSKKGGESQPIFREGSDGDKDYKLSEKSAIGDMRGKRGAKAANGCIVVIALPVVIVFLMIASRIV